MPGYYKLTDTLGTTTLKTWGAFALANSSWASIGSFDNSSTGYITTSISIGWNFTVAASGNLLFFLSPYFNSITAAGSSSMRPAFQHYIGKWEGSCTANTVYYTNFQDVRLRPHINMLWVINIMGQTMANLSAVMRTASVGTA